MIRKNAYEYTEEALKKGRYIYTCSCTTLAIDPVFPPETNVWSVNGTDIWKNSFLLYKLYMFTGSW